jgi:hypothetical protein
MITVTVLSPRHGDKKIRCTPEQVFKLKAEQQGAFALVQDGRVVTTREQLVDEMDATLVPQIAGGLGR